METKTKEETQEHEVFVIERGFQEGKTLTTAQKSSALFSEEPVVLGKVLRRGSKPLRISRADYEANQIKLLQLEKAGAIKIQKPKENEMKPIPCAKCGQVPNGQAGKYMCDVCGLPLVYDPGASSTPVTPVEDPVSPPVVPPEPGPVVEAPVVAPAEEVPVTTEVASEPTEEAKTEKKSSKRK